MRLLFSKIWPYLLVGLILFLLGSWAYVSIKDIGRAEVQAQWDAQKQKDKDAIQAIKDDYAAQEQIHRQRNVEITHELNKAKQDHANALAAERARYGVRLQLSESRSAVYQRQAEGGAAQCRNLASHATRLDRTLEEGRYLVQELRGTLGLREDQLRQLGLQIQNDRLLFND